MKILKETFVLIIFLLSISAQLEAQETYSKVSIALDDITEMDRLAGLNFEIDHPEFIDNNTLILYVTQEELAILRQQQFNYEVLIADYRAYYAEMIQEDLQNITNMSRSAEVANGFDLGSMGGFYTFAEVEAKLDEMRTDYPNLITEKTSIGTTAEGRPIWMVKISDNPEIDEPEPTAYFDALHHAREPLSMATTINYMFWLLENYGTDSAVTYLVDNRELYFVPVVNPDGYVYNQTTDPDGGGFWRKNRRPNTNGCFGVDLNRNYSFGYANSAGCSSDDPCSGIYRGDMPFSEPESAAVRDLMLQIQPGTAFSTHSTAGRYLMPYGFEPTPPEFTIYAEWASSFLDDNDYTYGVTFQMLGYFSCGTTRDYLHSEGIYGWTPEIGGSGFWPPPSTIFDLVGENVRALYYQSWIAGGYLDVQSHTQIGDAIPGSSFELVIEAKNVGIGDDAQTVSVALEASDPGITVPTSIDYGVIAARSRKDNTANPFTVTIAPDFEGSSFTLTVYALQDGVVNEIREIPILIGNSTLLFSDNAESGSEGWTSDGNGIPWGVVADDSYSGNFSFGDSDGGNSENDTFNSFTLNQPFDFSATTTPVVRFESKQSLEEEDEARFEISIDGGVTWEVLRNYTLNEDWHSEIFVLDNYNGFSDVRFRFVMETDEFIPGDGFYFDDFQVFDYDGLILSNSDLLDANKISISPNPFQDSFSVRFENGDGLNIEAIELYDIAGRKLDLAFETSLNSVRVIPSGKLAKGVYFLKLKDARNADLLTRKMIKD